MSKGIKHIYEAFNFGSINNQKTPLNVVNTVLTPILYKIHNFEKLSDDEYNILISYTGIYKVSDKDELEKIIKYFIERFGNECNLNWIDVKNVTNMRNLFYYQQDFNGDISNWDVSNVTNMLLMFNYSKFDGDISNWDVSNVTNMKGMFEESIFNGDISLWNVSNVTDMSYMFCGARYFYSNINEWDVSNVRNMEYMFNESNFGLSFMNIDEWDVSNVTNMCCMFARTDFNKDISDWDVSNVTDMSCMFAESNFNQNISNWNINPNCNTDEMFDTCAIEDRYMPKLPKKQTKVNESFEFTSANNQKAHINIYDELPAIKECLDNFKELENYQYHILTTIPGFYKVENISLLKKLIPYFIGQFGNDCNLNWIDTSNITDMYALFMSTEFNGDISKWDVSNVTIMSLMFANSKFNGDIRGWDVSKVSDMSSMFNMSKFNKDISKWDVSNVTNMRRMFYNAEFNGDISRWDVSNVTTMEGMFAYSKFNGDITGWRPSIEDNVNMHNMFLSCGMKKTPLWYTEDHPVMEAFDFNSVADKKPSITANIKRFLEDVIKNKVLPLFNNLRPDYIERCKFIPEHRFIGNKCELLYQNKVIIDFTFGYDYIEVMNVYDTTRLTVVGYNSYIQDISVIFYIVRLIPIPINSLNFCYDSSKYPTYKLEGSMGHDELIDLTRIMEDYTDKLPKHITFNSKYIDLYNLRFENENAIKKFIYKLRKDNGELKYEIKQCIFITETPPEFRGLIGTSRSKGTTSKLIRKYIKAPVNTLLEGFNFDSVDKKKILPSLSMKDRVLLFDNFLKDLYDKHVLTGMQYGNKYFSDAWSKAKSDLEFNGIYYKCEADGDHLNVELNYMNLYFQSPEDYNQFCEDIKIFKDIRIDGLLSIYMKTMSLRMQRLENFGELGKTITFVKELDINNLILHDFEGMPEVESFKANRTTIFTFNHFKYNDSVNNIELYYKPGQHCVIDWTGFPKKIYGLFSYTLDTDIDSTPGGYIIAFQKQLTTFKGFPEDFMFVTNPTNIMKVGQPNFIDINMPKWVRDQIKEHIMDLLLQEFPNRLKRERIYKRLTKIYRYR